MINIKRSEKRGKVGYTNISNEILQSKTLKPIEIGILVHFLSLPPDFVIHKSSIWKQMNIGRDQFDKVWNKLVQLGYIQTKKYRKDDSKKTFGYRHIVSEIPQSPENQSMEKQYTDKQDIRSLITSNWKPGCIQINNTNTTRTVSNSRNEVKVRHGRNPDQKTLDPIVLDQKLPDQQVLDQQIPDQQIPDLRNIIEENQPIVPTPQLCFGIGRDNDGARNNTSSTEEHVFEQKKITSTVGPCTVTDVASIGERFWDTTKILSPKVQDYWEEEPDEIDIKNFRNAIDNLYNEEIPDWEDLLRANPLHMFLKETSKIHSGIPVIVEMITIIYQKFKQEAREELISNDKQTG